MTIYTCFSKGTNLPLIIVPDNKYQVEKFIQLHGLVRRPFWVDSTGLYFVLNNSLSMLTKQDITTMRMPPVRIIERGIPDENLLEIRYLSNDNIGVYLFKEINRIIIMTINAIPGKIKEINYFQYENRDEDVELINVTNNKSLQIVMVTSNQQGDKMIYIEQIANNIRFEGRQYNICGSFCPIKMTCPKLLYYFSGKAKQFRHFNITVEKNGLLEDTHFIDARFYNNGKIVTDGISIYFYIRDDKIIPIPKISRGSIASINKDTEIVDVVIDNENVIYTINICGNYKSFLYNTNILQQPIEVYKSFVDVK